MIAKKETISSKNSSPLVSLVILATHNITTQTIRDGSDISVQISALFGGNR